MVFKALVRIFPSSVAEILSIMVYAIMSAFIVYYFFEPQASFSYLAL